MPREFRQRYLRLLPAVDKILLEKSLAEIEEGPRALIVEAVKEVLAEKGPLFPGLPLKRN